MTLRGQRLRKLQKRANPSIQTYRSRTATTETSVTAAMAAYRMEHEGEGVVYVRSDVKTGKNYVGQSQSELRFRQRQHEHVREHPDSDFEFEILGRARTGEQLDRKEEYYIRQMGGPKNKANPDGLLANKRHQMNDQRYLDAGGDY